MQQLRIAFYSHDAMGLGHLRRNLLLADAFARVPTKAQVLLMAGAPVLNAFSIPAGVDCVTLPALKKNRDGTYGSRNSGTPLAELLSLRSEILFSALRAFEPHVFIVDKHPRGILGELDSITTLLRGSGSTRFVLGLRDVLDTPETVSREWAGDQAETAIEENYDAVWVYGDPKVYDPGHEYDLSPTVASKLRYTGYLDPSSRIREEDWREPETLLGLPPGKLALCLVGGGQDGAPLARAFAEAVPSADVNGVILTGPFMPRSHQEELRRLADRCPRLRVAEFVANPGALINRADRVVTMGGYNTVCEVLSAGKPLLVVPRVHPRSEQLIRAERLEKLQLLEMIHPEHVEPSALQTWLDRDARSNPAARDTIDFDGLTRLHRLLEETLAPAVDPLSSRRVSLGGLG